MTTEIDSDCENNEDLKTQKIVVFSECKVPSSRHNNTAYDIIRAHPNYRPGHNIDHSSSETKAPWHDWVEVEYHSGIACGRVMLLCWIHFADSSLDQSYAMINTLTGKGKSLRNMEVCQSCDKFAPGQHMLQFVPVMAIKSVAYVLPSIDKDDPDRSNYNQYFQTVCEKNSHFMVVQPVEKWK